MNNIKAVLFDLDDTLFDHRHSARAALGFLKERFDDKLSAISLDELERAHLEILNEIHTNVLDGTISLDEARIKRFAILFPRYDVILSEEEQYEVSSLYRIKYQAARRATIGAINLLHALRLREVRIGVVSNNLLEEQLDKMQHCGLAPFIDSYTISEEAGVSKPDPHIFQIALERLQCAPGSAVMVGDSWTSDILGARAAGIRAIWYNCFGYSIPLEKDSRFHLEEIPQLRSFENLRDSLDSILS